VTYTQQILFLAISTQDTMKFVHNTKMVETLSTAANFDSFGQIQLIKEKDQPCQGQYGTSSLRSLWVGSIRERVHLRQLSLEESEWRRATLDVVCALGAQLARLPRTETLSKQSHNNCILWGEKGDADLLCHSSGVRTHIHNRPPSVWRMAWRVSILTVGMLT